MMTWKDRLIISALSAPLAAMIVLAVQGADVLAVVTTVRAPDRVIEQQREIKKLSKMEVRRVLNPATIDGISNLNQMKRYLKAQQGVLKILVLQSMEKKDL